MPHAEQCSAGREGGVEGQERENMKTKGECISHSGSMTRLSAEMVAALNSTVACEHSVNHRYAIRNHINGICR